MGTFMEETCCVWYVWVNPKPLGLSMQPAWIISLRAFLAGCFIMPQCECIIIPALLRGDTAQTDGEAGRSYQLLHCYEVHQWRWNLSLHNCEQSFTPAVLFDPIETQCILHLAAFSKISLKTRDVIDIPLLGTYHSYSQPTLRYSRLPWKRCYTWCDETDPPSLVPHIWRTWFVLFGIKKPILSLCEISWLYFKVPWNKANVAFCASFCEIAWDTGSETDWDTQPKGLEIELVPSGPGERIVTPPYSRYYSFSWSLDESCWLPIWNEHVLHIKRIEVVVFVSWWFSPLISFSKANDTTNIWFSHYLLF